MAGLWIARQHRYKANTGAASPAWSRTRLLALLIGVTCLIGLLLWGLVATVLSATGIGGGDAADHLSSGRSVHILPGGSGPSARELAERDALAARAMPGTSEGTYKPSALSTRDPGAPLVLPAGRGVDRLGVATRFPHTRQGAVAQLASIDQTALQSASLPGVRAVISEWAAPGGPTSTTWSGVKAMADLLSSIGLSGAGSPRLSVVLTPAMGLIKGTVGPDFAVVCVDFVVDVTFDQTASAAVADCERMVWRHGRWVIGPGKEPFEAPSFWPDTDAAIDAGWRDLSHE